MQTFLPEGPEMPDIWYVFGLRLFSHYLTRPLHHRGELYAVSFGFVQPWLGFTA